jgi:putative hydrolase of the HAD superfamily
LPEAAGRRAVLLDALGTLVGLEPPWVPFAQALSARHGLAIEPDEAVRVLRAEMGYYRDHCQSARDAASLAELRRQCVEVVAAELAPAELDRETLTGTLLESLRFAAYPDAPVALERLRADGVRLVVVSNWDISLHDVLEQTGLRPLLDGVITSAEFGSGKPDPAIFEAALAVADVPASDALHVGDSVEEDVVGARAAGIDSVLLVREEQTLFAPAGENAGAGVARIGSLDRL